MIMSVQLTSNKKNKRKLNRILKKSRCFLPRSKRGQSKRRRQVLQVEELRNRRRLIRKLKG